MDAMIWSQVAEHDIGLVKMKKRVKNMPELQQELNAAGKTILYGVSQASLHNMAT